MRRKCVANDIWAHLEQTIELNSRYYGSFFTRNDFKFRESPEKN